MMAKGEVKVMVLMMVRVGLWKHLNIVCLQVEKKVDDNERDHPYQSD